MVWFWFWYPRFGVDPARGACNLPWLSVARLGLVTVVPAYTPSLGATGPRHAEGCEGGGEGEDGETQLVIQHRAPVTYHRSQLAATCGQNFFE